MKTIYKPWGKEEWLELNDKYCYKRIYINSGHKTSYQYHDFKRETNYLISGQAEIWLENDEGVVEKFIMNAGEYFNVTPPKKHRVIAITDIILQEVSTPEVDDVIRIDDDTNRKDGRLEHEHLKPALCIVAAGKGTRMGEYAKHINKGLLPIDNKAIISDIINKTTNDYEIIIATGYKSEQVIEYCKAAHPDRLFTFVDVGKYEGEETGMGYSLLKCKEHLQRPFYCITGDCLIKDKLPLLDSNWLGLHPTSIPEIYSTAKLDKDMKITNFINKDKNGYNQAFIGLCGIFDFELFWNELESNMGKSGEMVSAFYNIEKYNAVGKILNWYDIGTIENYIKAQKTFTTQKYGIPKTNGQFLYKINGKCIKMFQDSVEEKCHRADNLGDLTPELKYRGNNAFSYDWVKGSTLYESKLEDQLNFIDWIGSEIHSNIEDVDISKDCKKFYIEKTQSRLKTYLEYAPAIMECALTINGKEYKPLDYYLDQIDEKDFSSSLPTIKWHGDMQFDNIIKTSEGFKFIDWRDTFGDSIDHGDAYYDLSKLYGGICMNYSYMKDEKNYTYTRNFNRIEYSFKGRGNQLLHQRFYDMTQKHGYSYDKIKIITALIYLNMSPLHEKGLDHLLFAHAITVLSDIYD
mgnify:CR=1 FL=1